MLEDYKLDLPSIIHYNQSAYVKGRPVFDAIRTIDDVLEYTERYKIDGHMVAVDFQKAFDSVNKNSLYETLSTFGFGPSFLQWVRTFYQNISSCVVNNRFATSHFPIQRGVRQGDPLSPYLFITVLCKSNANVFRRNSRCFLAFRRKNIEFSTKSHDNS